MPPTRNLRRWRLEDFRGDLRFVALALFVCFAVADGMAALAQGAEWRWELFSLVFVLLIAVLLLISRK